MIKFYPFLLVEHTHFIEPGREEEEKKSLYYTKPTTDEWASEKQYRYSQLIHNWAVHFFPIEGKHVGEFFPSSHNKYS